MYIYILTWSYIFWVGMHHQVQHRVPRRRSGMTRSKSTWDFPRIWFELFHPSLPKCSATDSTDSCFYFFGWFPQWKPLERSLVSQFSQCCLHVAFEHFNSQLFFELLHGSKGHQIHWIHWPCLPLIVWFWWLYRSGLNCISAGVFQGFKRC